MSHPFVHKPAVLFITFLAAVPAQAGSISGRITDQGSGAGLADIDLDLYDGSGNVLAAFDANTDPAGNFSFTNLPNGTYKVKADPPLPPASYYVDELWAGSSNQNAYETATAAVVRVSAASPNVTGIDFKLERGGTISGRITGPGGTPLAGIDLDLFDAARARLSFSATTDASGNYQFKPFPTGAGSTGTFFVRADASKATFYVDRYYNGQADLAAASPISVTRQQDTPNVHFSLFLGGRIAGRISIQNPQPGDSPASIDLDLFDAATGAFLGAYDAVTDATGQYVLGAMPAGTYKLRADPGLATFLIPQFYSGQASLPAAQLLNVAVSATISADFVLQKGGTLAGTVRSTQGTPLPDIDLDVFEAGTGQFLGAYDARTDTAGSYLLGPLPQGLYLVRADAAPGQGYVDQFYAGSDFQAQATNLSVSTGTGRTGIDFALVRGWLIRGKVTDAASPSTPIPGLDLDVYDPAGQLLPYDDEMTSADGSYTIGPLRPGTYLLRADPSAPTDYFDQFYSNAIDRSGAVPIVVDNSDVTVDFALIQGHLFRGGVLERGTGRRLAGVEIEVYDQNGVQLGLPQRTTTSTGRYSIGPVAPGQYFLRAVPPAAEPHQPRYYLDSATLGGAAPILVTQDDVNNLYFSLVNPLLPPVSAEISWGLALAVFGPAAFAALRRRRRSELWLLLAVCLGAAAIERPAEAGSRRGTFLRLEAELSGSYLSSLDELQPHGELSLTLERRGAKGRRESATLRMEHDRQRLKLFNFAENRIGAERLFTTMTELELELEAARRLSPGALMKLQAKGSYRDGADPGDDLWSARIEADGSLRLRPGLDLKLGYSAALTRYPDYEVAGRKLDSLRQRLSAELEIRPMDRLRARLLGAVAPKQYLKSTYDELDPQGENRNVVRSGQDRFYRTTSGGAELELRWAEDGRVELGYEHGANDTFHDNRLVLRKRFVRDYFDYRYDQAHLRFRMPLPGGFSTKAQGSLEWRRFANYPARDGLGGFLDERRRDKELALRVELSGPRLGLGRRAKARWFAGLVHLRSRSNSKDADIDETDFYVNYSYTQILTGIGYQVQ
jgi:hypothetical protein